MCVHIETNFCCQLYCILLASTTVMESSQLESGDIDATIRVDESAGFQAVQAGKPESQIRSRKKRKINVSHI